MRTTSIDQMLASTLEDLRLSRAERTALGSALSDVCSEERDLDLVRSRAFAVAREALAASRDTAVVDWLESVVKTIAALRPEAERAVEAEACFSPGRACVTRLVSLLDAARRSVDICVFTLTDDRITEAVIRAHRRGVTVRIITDNLKASDLGSDVERLEAAGITVAVDTSTAHMHHKFALFDHQRLVTGSYNWTRSAADENAENLVVIDHPTLLERFAAEFDRLWTLYRPSHRPAT